MFLAFDGLPSTPTSFPKPENPASLTTPPSTLSPTGSMCCQLYLQNISFVGSFSIPYCHCLSSSKSLTWMCQLSLNWPYCLGDLQSICFTTTKVIDLCISSSLYPCCKSFTGFADYKINANDLSWHIMLFIIWAIRPLFSGPITCWMTKFPKHTR